MIGYNLSNPSAYDNWAVIRLFLAKLILDKYISTLIGYAFP